MLNRKILKKKKLKSGKNSVTFAFHNLKLLSSRNMLRQRKILKKTRKM
jgi:hypothetical protein